MSSSHSIFPVPIWGHILNSEVYHFRDYIDKILQLEHGSTGVKKSNQGGWQSQDNLNELGIFQELVGVLNSLLTSMAREHSKDAPPLTVTEMWANINNPGSYNHHHTHSGILSGAFYLKVPENSGNLVLVNPAVRSDGHFLRAPNYVVTPSPLACIVFPSWLEHYVEPNQSDEDRISISFNSNFK